jgi:hypothetical protein
MSPVCAFDGARWELGYLDAFRRRHERTTPKEGFMTVLLLVLTFAVLILVDRLVIRHWRVNGLRGCASARLCLVLPLLSLLPSVSAAAAHGALPATTPSAMDLPGTFWLDLTNVALGLVTLACLVAVLIAVVKEISNCSAVDSMR